MKSIYKDIPLIKNEEKRRYEIGISGNQIALVHTETEPGIK